MITPQQLRAEKYWASRDFRVFYTTAVQGWELMPGVLASEFDRQLIISSPGIAGYVFVTIRAAYETLRASLCGQQGGPSMCGTLPPRLLPYCEHGI